MYTSMSGSPHYGWRTPRTVQLIFKGELRNLYTDLQTRWVFIRSTVGSLALTAILYANGQYATFEGPFRIALFQFVSATSNTGFGAAAIGGGTEQVWSTGPTLLACLGMLTGVAAGSTVSGLKLIRVITLVEGTVWRIEDIFRPSSARFSSDSTSTGESDSPLVQSSKEATHACDRVRIYSDELP